MNEIKNKSDRGFVMGWSTSLMTALANMATLVLFPVSWSQAELNIV